jgi:hypothetical protein
VWKSLQSEYSPFLSNPKLSKIFRLYGELEQFFDTRT